MGWRTYRENVIFAQKTSERVAPNQHLLLVNLNPLRSVYLRVIIFPQILDLPTKLVKASVLPLGTYLYSRPVTFVEYQVLAVRAVQSRLEAGWVHGDWSVASLQS